jgi:hypothetical protein
MGMEVCRGSLTRTPSTPKGARFVSARNGADPVAVYPASYLSAPLFTTLVMPYLRRALGGYRSNPGEPLMATSRQSAGQDLEPGLLQPSDLQPGHRIETTEPFSDVEYIIIHKAPREH